MANVRDFRTRIRSVKSTQQITRAMYLVSAAKMRRAQEKILAVRPYALKMLDVLSSLAARVETSTHPLLARREERKVLVVVMSADKGLCGSFNTNILNPARSFIASLDDREVQVDVIGKKARDWFKRRTYTLRRVDVDLFKNIEPAQARDIGWNLVNPFVAGEFDAVYLVYNEFKSIMHQRPIVERLLPIPVEIFERGVAAGSDEAVALMGRAASPAEGAAPLAAPGVAAPEHAPSETPMRPEDYIYEPDDGTLFDRLLPRHVGTQVYRALLESAAAEQGARMTAMNNATRNAADMIDALTLQMNKIRQAAITKEILEVVGGAEALK
ncbi:MAG TPA: ATP synthase F1 subunit gamma [Candidatus Polarisedimenticolia bacterium]|nr:ATP synthase F1 subunit gamma [Candidatus Polarisedimenticolia bacterium]